jgi:hypothetical protein
MLLFSLFLSAVLFVVANRAARRARRPVRETVCCAVLVCGFQIMGFMFLPAVWLQAAILCAGLLVAARFDGARRATLPLSILSVVIAYGVVGYFAVEEQQKYEELRARFPFESMEERLPRAAPASSGGDAQRLNRLEGDIDQQVFYSGQNRERTLRELHEATVEQFANSPGFGVGRMVPPLYGRGGLEEKPREDTPSQPEPDYFSPQLARQPIPATKLPNLLALGKLHDESFLDFVNPKGFGYVKDRQHVAGFQSHGFSKVPGPAGQWKVASLELVGLVRHENPVVYVSPRLPRMDELRDAPTRQPDAFETAALGALRGGADLHIGDGSDGARFVGAIRAVKQCVECHGCQRGDLLGAFTYRLRPAP